MHHVVELFGVVAVGIDAGVGAEGHFHSGGVRPSEIVALDLADAALLGRVVPRSCRSWGRLEDVVVVVDVHDEIGAVGFGEAMPSSSTSEACSMESMPASMAHLMDCVPWAWAAILRPAWCAVSAATLSSSSVY